MAPKGSDESGSSSKFEDGPDSIPDVTDWLALRQHAARDAIILVSPALDLDDVARKAAADDKVAVQAWIAKGLLGKPTEDQLKAWEKSPDRPFRFKIVAPYVLAQLILDS